jgi:tetratricopeptide (TPR) repeat protein
MKRFLVWLFVIVGVGVVWIAANNPLYDHCLKGSVGACTAFINIYPFGRDQIGAYHNRGMAYKRQGNIEKAIADFRTALANSSNDAADLEREQLRDLGAAP